METRSRFPCPPYFITFIHKDYLLSENIQQSDINTVMNIDKFYMVLTRFQFLSPFINKLVKLKPNTIFNFIFDISRRFNQR
jgi:hypothetical protein